MGYRSDVAYRLEFHNEEQWNVFLIEAKAKPETRLCFEDEDLKVDYENHAITLVACGVKWYSDYPDVSCHDKLLELCDAYNERFEETDGYVCSYLFRRVGESEDDIETRDGGDADYDWIELQRSLLVNW